jgi:hypothetical protein
MPDMRVGICPKCQSTEVYTNVDDRDFNISVRVDWMRSVVPSVFLCASCGYLEQFVLDPRQRQYAVEKWARADGRGQQADDDEKRKNDER